MILKDDKATGGANLYYKSSYLSCTQPHSWHIHSCSLLDKSPPWCRLYKLLCTLSRLEPYTAPPRMVIKVNLIFVLEKSHLAGGS